MITVDFFTTADGDLLGFSMKGHADSGTSGEDIVCAAVSSATYMTANTITDVLGVFADISVDDGFMLLRILPKDSLRCREILSGFKLHMIALSEQYSKNICVNYMEV